MERSLWHWADSIVRLFIVKIQCSDEMARLFVATHFLCLPCTHLSGQALPIWVLCRTLLSSTIFFSFSCLCVKWIVFFFCHAPPPLHQFDLCLPHEQSCLLLSCVSLVFRFLPPVNTSLTWLDVFPCSASFLSGFLFFYSYGLFLESLTSAVFVVVVFNGQVNNSYLIQPKRLLNFHPN